MAWGDSFKSAWNGATSAARNSAAAIATGAKAVGKKALEGAQWAADKATEAANWANDQAKSATRAAVRGLVDTVGDASAKVKDAYDAAKGSAGKAKEAVANKINSAFDRVNRLFGKTPPKTPSVPCPKQNTPTSDIDLDGALIGYTDDKCGPMTAKGKPVTEDDIASAKEHGYRSKSKCCQGKPARTIYYVNGIKNSRKDHCDTLKAIGDSTCATVVGVYNATEGWPADLLQAAKDRVLVKAAAEGHKPGVQDGPNPAVATLGNVILNEVSAGNPPEIWAHSQGGAIASLALYDANNSLKANAMKEPLKGVKVKSFGSAAPSWVDGPNYEHYVHVNDATPLYAGLGDNPAKDKILFSGDPKKGMFQTANLDKHYLADPTKYHGIEETYVRMQQQVNGGCSGKP